MTGKGKIKEKRGKRKKDRAVSRLQITKDIATGIYARMHVYT